MFDVPSFVVLVDTQHQDCCAETDPSVSRVHPSSPAVSDHTPDHSHHSFLHNSDHVITPAPAFQHKQSTMSGYNKDSSLVVVTDYLTNPYVINMSLARSRSMADRNISSAVQDRRKQNFMESISQLKQSLPIRSSFSFGSRLMKRDASFSFRLFSSKSSSISFSDSASTSSSVSCHSHKSTEEFWNQYRRNQPKLSSFTLRTKQVYNSMKLSTLVSAPASIHEKSPTPPTPTTISL